MKSLKLITLLAVSAFLFSNVSNAEPDKRLKAQVQKLIKDFDTDGDGKLSAEEIKKASQEKRLRIKPAKKEDKDKAE